MAGATPLDPRCTRAVSQTVGPRCTRGAGQTVHSHGEASTDAGAGGGSASWRVPAEPPPQAAVQQASSAPLNNRQSGSAELTQCKGTDGEDVDAQVEGGGAALQQKGQQDRSGAQPAGWPLLPA